MCDPECRPHECRPLSGEDWAAAARMNHAYPNAHMVHLPLHASWLNQVEIYFSAVQRKALHADDFMDLDAVAARLIACTRDSLEYLTWRSGISDGQCADLAFPAHAESANGVPTISLPFPEATGQRD